MNEKITLKFPFIYCLSFLAKVSVACDQTIPILGTKFIDIVVTSN